MQQDAVFRVYAQKYYDAYKKPHLSPGSRANWGSAMDNHILPYIGDMQMRAVSAMDLQEIMNRLIGKGKTLIGDVNSILENVFTYATAHGVIERNPALGLVRPDYETEQRRALDSAETAAVLKLARTHKDGLLLLLLYYTGLRRGEALGLQWGDIDFEKAVLHVRRDIDYVLSSSKVLLYSNKNIEEQGD